MPMTPRELIDEARDYHPDFDRHQTPEKGLARRLELTARKLVRQAAQLEPEPLASLASFTDTEIEEALATTGGRLAVPAFITPITARVVHVDSSGYERAEQVEFVVEKLRLDKDSYFPSLTVETAGIRLTDLRAMGVENHGWQDIQSLDWFYVAEPSLALDGDGNPLPLDAAVVAPLTGTPDALRSALVLDLAIFLAMRLGIQTVSYRAELRSEQQAFIDGIRQQAAATPWHVGGPPGLGFGAAMRMLS